jgi:hypothetical protein
MTPEQKNWIDQASYMDLLRKWRFAPAGDSYFIGDTGEYYAKVMAAKRSQENDGGVAASMAIGWK